MTDKTMTSDEYVGKLGLQCPHCHSTNISGGEVNIDAGTATQVIVCFDCDSEWLDVYNLAGYADLQIDA
jgi:transcription elongation factor Elf1